MNGPVPQQQAGGSNPARGNRRRWRGARNPGANRTNGTQNAQSETSRSTTPMIPASIPPIAAPAPEQTPATTSGNNGGGDGQSARRGGREQGPRNRGPRRNPQAGQAAEGANSNGSNRIAAPSLGGLPSRTFGGQLTRNNQGGESGETSSLQGDAPEFVPGQQNSPRGHRPRASANHPKATNGQVASARRGSIAKSTAPDIASRTHEDISKGVYECPICTSEVHRKSKVWSCRTCWTVFHLTCIKKWSKNEGSAMAQQQAQDGEFPPARQWRCPGCNLPKDVLPADYTCWCEKEQEPRSPPGIPPHSCGQTCGKSRVLPKNCPHPCELLCHAGPCPPCNHMGPTQSCFCGKQSASRRCAETNYESGWSCGEVCGDLMPCGEHMCQRPCHEGLCGACEEVVEARCYCGKVEKTLPCCEQGIEKNSKEEMDGDEKKVEVWTGSFDCGSTCERLMDCGIHPCEKGCHPQDLKPSHCPRSPDVVSHCPCGKTPLPEISDKTRTTCEDRIPNCNKRCLKPLPCGHPCEQICHSGECHPCLRKVSITCRCGRTPLQTICHQGFEEQPQCPRPCRVTLSCGRHQCDERCCPGERRAIDRQANKRKLKPLASAPRSVGEDFEPEHICTRVCGRTLKCGNHPCPELCHRGPCGSCREAIFDDISCNCGRTVLQPPLPCGTKPPPCRFDCERPKTCGHPRVPHNCHGDEESCPKCPFLMEKGCMCGKKSLKNQPCWLSEIRCGEVCGRKLKCGSHFCKKPCHRPGECEDAKTRCQQPCGKPKKACGHPCEDRCHAPSACHEDKPCPFKLLITCDCQHLKQEMKCNASKSGEGNTKKTLQCTDECARLERNRKLATALNIDPATHTDDHVPYSADTLNMYQSSPKWAQEQEKEFRVFAADEKERRLRFKPMQAHHRAFLHALAEDFGFDSESMDPEPHRHVAVFKTPRFVSAPMKTIGQCVKIRHTLDSIAGAEALARKAAAFAPYNGLLLRNPRFGLTIDELRADIASDLRSCGLIFDIAFLPNEEVAFRYTGPSMTESNLENALKVLKPTLARTITSKSLASNVHLCTLDSSLNVTRQESDSSNGVGGWSQVAASKAKPAMAPKTQGIGGKTVFTVLSSRMKEKEAKEKVKEKKRKESVVDDWEVAEEADERASRVASEGEGEGDARGQEQLDVLDATTGQVEHEVEVKPEREIELA